MRDRSKNRKEAGRRTWEIRKQRGRGREREREKKRNTVRKTERKKERNKQTNKQTNKQRIRPGLCGNDNEADV